MDHELLRVEQLRKSLAGGFSLELEDLSLKRGRLYAVVGPNGAGKTVLLKMLSFLESPDEGRIYLDGQELGTDERLRLKALRQMTLVMQDPYLFHTSVSNNVAFGLRARGLKREIVASRVEEMLARVGLAGLGPRHAHELSGGEQKRVAIARALVLEPSILFLDEPTANVDGASVTIVERMLERLKRDKNTTVVLSTLDREQAYRLADDIYLMLDGRLHAHQPENLFAGELEGEEDLKWFRLSPRTRIQVEADRTGPARVSIDPRAILLSQQPVVSSGRNCLAGTITRALVDGSEVQVGVDVDGTVFTTRLTRRSYDEMKFNVGQRIYLTFKVTGVQVY